MAMENKLKEMERVLKALANRRRLAILKFLKDRGEKTVSDISDEIGLSIKSTSKHLTKLRAVDLVDYRQVGLSVWYKLKQPKSPQAKQVISSL